MKTLDYLALVPARHRRRAVLGTIAVAAVLGLVIAILDRPLADAGDGTIAFEFAASPDRAAEIVDNWEEEGVLARAAFITGLDFLYALAYSLALAVACLAAAMHWRGTSQTKRAETALRIAMLMPLAGAFDWVENIALTTSLVGDPTAPWPAVATAAAVPKFTLVAIGLGTAIAGGISALRKR